MVGGFAPFGTPVGIEGDVEGVRGWIRLRKRKAITTTKLNRVSWMLLAVVGVVLNADRADAYIFLSAWPLPDRVATADVVAFGKITAQENKMARVALYPDPKVEARFDLRFFELSITEVIKGELRAKTVRVAIFDHEQLPKLKIDAEGCFALGKHFEQDFYIVGSGMFFNKASKDYEKETALLRRYAKLLNAPEKGLASKDQADRYMTAYLLIHEFGWTQQRKLTQDLVEEPIDPKLSKLILKAIVEADWSHPTVRNDTPLDIPHPNQTIPMLKLDAVSKAKWPTVSPFDDKYEETVLTWLRDNAETARLQRMVPKKK